MSATENAVDDLFRELADVEARVLAIKEKAGLIPPRSTKPFDDEEREALRDRLKALSDVDLISSFLTLHTGTKLRATGRQREMLERQTVLMTTLLERFAPEAFADALAVWSEHSEDDDV